MDSMEQQSASDLVASWARGRVGRSVSFWFGASNTGSEFLKGARGAWFTRNAWSHHSYLLTCHRRRAVALHNRRASAMERLGA